MKREEEEITIAKYIYIRRKGFERGYGRPVNQSGEVVMIIWRARRREKSLVVIWPILYFNLV